jgi:hypothetical protein
MLSMYDTIQLFNETRGRINSIDALIGRKTNKTTSKIIMILSLFSVQLGHRVYEYHNRISTTKNQGFEYCRINQDRNRGFQRHKINQDESTVPLQRGTYPSTAKNDQPKQLSPEQRQHHAHRKSPWHSHQQRQDWESHCGGAWSTRHGRRPKKQS